MRAQPFGRAAPAVPAAPVIGGTQVRQRAGVRRPPPGRAVRLGGARGRGQGLVGRHVIPELLVGNAAERLDWPQFLIDVGSLAPAHATARPGRRVRIVGLRAMPGPAARDDGFRIF
jgi:hypothetical protein